MIYSKRLLFTTGLALMTTASSSIPAQASAKDVPIIPLIIGRGELENQGERQPIAHKQSTTPRYTPPPDRGTPPSRKTTGSRGNCFYHSERPPLAALVGQSHLSWTISDRPTIWIYSPYTVTDTLQAELVLQVETTDEELYRGMFSLNNSPGVQGIQLPTSLEPLEVGKTYRWYIDVFCQDANEVLTSTLNAANPATLTGVIERVSVSIELQQNLNRVSGYDELAFYGRSHLWYDMLTTLARQRLENPGNSNLSQTWQALLEDDAYVGLGFLSKEPLLDFFHE